MRTLVVFDSQPITRRERTEEQYLKVPGLIAASDNVQPYFAGELGIKGVDPKKIIRVFRPKAEVDKAAKTFDGKPVTLEHPKTMVSAKIWRAVGRGEVYDTHPVELGLESTLLVRDEQAIQAVESGRKKELSAAYDFHLELTPGVSPRGEAYDGVASDFRGNHVAIVGTARGGHACRVADSTTGERSMRVIAFDAARLGALSGFRAELEEPSATLVEDTINHLVTARDAATAERDSVVTECAGKLEAQAADHAAKLKALEDGIPARVEAEAMDRASVLAGAERIGLKLEAQGKDTLSLRREVLTHAQKDPSRKAVVDAMVTDIAKVDAATAKLATAAVFAAPAVDSKKQPARAHDALGDALAGKKKTSAKDGDDKPMGREAALASSRDAWKMRGKDKSPGCAS